MTVLRTRASVGPVFGPMTVPQPSNLPPPDIIVSGSTGIIGLGVFTWWEMYLIAWVVALPSVLVSLIVLWGLPRWLEFDRPRWLWNGLTMALLSVAPLGILWVTLAVTPSGFLARRHAYSTLVYLAYQWLPGLVTLPPILLAGLLAWRWWTGSVRDHE